MHTRPRLALLGRRLSNARKRVPVSLAFPPARRSPRTQWDRTLIPALILNPLPINVPCTRALVVLPPLMILQQPVTEITQQGSLGLTLRVPRQHPNVPIALPPLKRRLFKTTRQWDLTGNPVVSPLILPNVPLPRLNVPHNPHPRTESVLSTFTDDLRVLQVLTVPLTLFLRASVLVRQQPNLGPLGQLPISPLHLLDVLLNTLRPWSTAVNVSWQAKPLESQVIVCCNTLSDPLGWPSRVQNEESLHKMVEVAELTVR